MKDYDIAIIGAGAAGMMAAVAALREGAKVCIIEKNEKPGKKIFITGKGRCNLTNACDTQDLFSAIVTNEKFMYSSLYTFTNFDTISFFEEAGMKTKIERGERVFPESDRSSDVIRTLQRECTKGGVKFLFHSTVKELLIEDGKLCGVQLQDGKKIWTDKVIVTTGGLSYQSTGSDGDGYRFATQTGHGVTECRPALVPLNIKGNAPGKMQGLSLKNVELSFFLKSKDESQKERELFRDFGEMMFTHFGITGPIVLSASSRIGQYLEKEGQWVLARLDCKPALSKEKLDKRILRDFEASSNSALKNVLGSLLPKSMIPVVIKKAGLKGDLPVHQVTKENREQLVNTIKGLEFEVAALRGWNEAVITQGGVSVGDINPSTLESRKIRNLYFAGEVLDVDAVTGGYNLQIAWSTGYLAGQSAAQTASE